MNWARRDAGFTLLEILVVTAVTLMIAIAAAGGLRLGARAWEGASRGASAAVEAHALTGFLRALAQGAQPVLWRDGTRAPPALFVGDAGGFTMAARLPSALAPPTPQLVSLRAERRGDGAALTLRWRPLNASAPRLAAAPKGWDDAAAELLTDDLRTARFRYGDGDAMAPTWRGRPTPPRLIEITLQARDGTLTTVLAAPMASGGPP